VHGHEIAHSARRGERLFDEAAEIGDERVELFTPLPADFSLITAADPSRVSAQTTFGTLGERLESAARGQA
jgi:hypothetical protein